MIYNIVLPHDSLICFSYSSSHHIYSRAVKTVFCLLIWILLVVQDTQRIERGAVYIHPQPGNKMAISQLQHSSQYTHTLANNHHAIGLSDYGSASCKLFIMILQGVVFWQLSLERRQLAIGSILLGSKINEIYFIAKIEQALYPHASTLRFKDDSKVASDYPDYPGCLIVSLQR